MDWYLAHSRSLPWRTTSDPYCIWVSEVMLQQTQVGTVLPYYERFVQRFPDMFHLAEADLEDVLRVWEGLGYYARARNLLASAGIIVRQYGGVLPDDYVLFHHLPGVGDYIASAVLSIAYGKPFAVIDGNVKRILARVNMIDAPLNNHASKALFQVAAERLLSRNRPGDHNQAMMELGALICTPKSPGCVKCPIQKFCRASLENKVAQYPKKTPRPKTPLIHISTGVVHDDGKVLIARRKSEGLLGGLWEFPGGKIERGESAEAACIREFEEELNIKIRVDGHIACIRHAYTHFRIVMNVFKCRRLKGEVCLNGPVDYRWVRFEDLDQHPFPRANRKFMHLLPGIFNE